MNPATWILTGVSTILALTMPVHSVQAQDKAQVQAQDKTSIVIDRYTCRELLRESGSDRDVAIAFMHGYILGKAGATTINVETLHKQSAAFIDRCLDNPQAPALTTMLGSVDAAKPRSP